MHPKDAPTASADAILHDVLDVVTSLKNGHFTTHMPENLPGVGNEISKAMNELIEMLQSFRHEHHRLMEEVGTTGRLGGQMEVAGVNGAWKEMLDDVNKLGVNITCQLRDGGNVARALLAGDLSARMTCRMIQGEFREFRERFNQIAEQLEQNSSEPVPS
jgi:hypothetical protein